MFSKLETLKIWLENNNHSAAADLDDLIKQADSVGNIVRLLGYPKVVAKVLQKMFGKNSFIMAKWLKEYNTRDNKWEQPNDWIERIGAKEGGLTSHSSIMVLLDLYNAETPSEYINVKKEYDLYISDEEKQMSEYELSEIKESLEEEIEFDIQGNMLFYYSLPSDVLSGKVTNLSPYKSLPPMEAFYEYNRRTLFNDKEPLLSYENGWRWIDAGKKCEYLGQLMRNCGSAGVMSSDVDRTILALFDEHNKPHVMVTYSPNQNRISGDTGGASTPVKNQYHHYVIDLANHLGANFDSQKSSSKELALKWELKDHLKDIEIVRKDTYDNIFKITLNNGDVFYTDSRKFVSEQDYDNAYKQLLYVINEGQDSEAWQEMPYVFPTKENLPSMIFNLRLSQYLRDKAGVDYVGLDYIINQNQS